MTIAIVGNPNSGKSSIFNKLTGLRQKTGNFPGVTVEKKSGKLALSKGNDITLIDFPGTYSLYPTSSEERIVLNVFTNPNDANYPDAVVYVADVTNLEKHLLLLTQIMDLGLPCLLALNMSDIADKKGIFIDENRLSKFLKIPVITVSGRTGSNLEILKTAIGQLLNPSHKKFEPFYSFNNIENKVAEVVGSITETKNLYRNKLIAHHFEKLPFLSKKEKEGINGINKENGFEDLSLQIVETMQRFDKFAPIAKKVASSSSKKTGFTDKVDAILTHKVFAPIIFFVIMLLVFQAIYAWASYPMDWIESGFAAINQLVKNTFPTGWATDLLTDGILAGLGGIMVFIPQIAILFFLISILEEAGYMARAVYIFDKLMQQFGMNGRSVVALISGGACAIPAIMSTRTISNWKERLITIMVTPLISCSARIPVYAVLIGFVVPSATFMGIFNLQGIAFMGLYLLGIASAFISALVFKTILKSNEQSFLMMQLPPYRWPVWRNVWQNALEKVSAFVVEAGKIIMIISIVLWALASYGPSSKMEQAGSEAITLAQEQSLDETATADLIAAKKIEASFAGHIGKAIEPAIQPLGFDWKIGIALITSFAAREVFVGTMATIYSIGSSEDEQTIRERLAAAKNPVTGAKVYSAATSLSLLIFYVFAMQCMSTLAVVKKETGSWKWAVIQFFYMSGLAYLGSFCCLSIDGLNLQLSRFFAILLLLHRFIENHLKNILVLQIYCNKKQAMNYLCLFAEVQRKKLR